MNRSAVVLRTGLDLIEIGRLSQVRPEIKKRFVKRVFTERELAESHGSDEFLSGRFAAKEAVSKALGTGIGKVRWQDIEILRGAAGEPLLELHGMALLVSEALGLNGWSVSITHNRTTAAAMAIAMGINFKSDGNSRDYPV